MQSLQLRAQGPRLQPSWHVNSSPVSPQRNKAKNWVCTTPPAQHSGASGTKTGQPTAGQRLLSCRCCCHKSYEPFTAQPALATCQGSAACLVESPTGCCSPWRARLPLPPAHTSPPPPAHPVQHQPPPDAPEGLRWPERAGPGQPAPVRLPAGQPLQHIQQGQVHQVPHPPQAAARAPPPPESCRPCRQVLGQVWGSH